MADPGTSWPLKSCEPIFHNILPSLSLSTSGLPPLTYWVCFSEERLIIQAATGTSVGQLSRDGPPELAQIKTQKLGHCTPGKLDMISGEVAFFSGSKARKGTSL